MIMIMIEIQYSGTALLLLVKLHIPHQNNDTMRSTYVYQLLSEKKTLCCQLYSTSSTNQQLFKKNFCNQSSHYENYRRFLLRMEVPITRLTHFSW